MNLLAVDVGATSGRVSLARFDGVRLTIGEVHRFPNDPVAVGGRLYWDVLRLFHEIKEGLRAGIARGGEIDCVGIDTWGLDFGLLDRYDHLMANPYHYRDRRASETMPEVWARLPKEEIYACTAIQFMPINSLYQLAGIAWDGSPNLDDASALMQIPDLFRFWLTGERGSEYTNATTTQFLGHATKDWDRDLLGRLEIPHHMLQPILRGPLMAGALRPAIQREIGSGSIAMAIVGQHDTASAVAAIPAVGDPFAYLSCGTWALLGTVMPRPIAGQEAFVLNMTNEGGLFEDYRFLKNIMGTWQLERCRAAWAAGGHTLTPAEIQRLAEAAPPFAGFVDPDAEVFFNPPDMPVAIRDWLTASGQPAPEDQGAIARIVYESIALKVAFVLEKIESLAGVRFAGLHVVGGGANSTLLCRSIASAIGCPVWAGPAEATTLGNAAAQLVASGQIAGADDLRRVVRASVNLVTYDPEDVDRWTDAQGRFRALIARGSPNQREEAA